MITDALIAMGAALLRFVLGGVPDASVPDWMTGGASMSSRVFQYAGSMGVWFPWTLCGVVIAAVLGTWAISFGIKVVRMLLSLFTAGGGSAA